MAAEARGLLLSENASKVLALNESIAYGGGEVKRLDGRDRIGRARSVESLFGAASQVRAPRPLLASECFPRHNLRVSAAPQ
jgi:hypothetical protein